MTASELAPKLRPDFGTHARVAAHSLVSFKGCGHLVDGMPAAQAGRVMTTPDAAALVVERAHQLASASVALSVGFEACAKHATNPHVVDAARKLAERHRLLVPSIAQIGLVVGARTRRTAATLERLRWEWLACTAALLDGTPDTRLVGECSRLVHLACEITVALHRGLVPLRSEAASSVKRLLMRLEWARSAVASIESECKKQPPNAVTARS